MNAPQLGFFFIVVFSLIGCQDPERTTPSEKLRIERSAQARAVLDNTKLLKINETCILTLRDQASQSFSRVDCSNVRQKEIEDTSSLVSEVNYLENPKTFPYSCLMKFRYGKNNAVVDIPCDTFPADQLLRTIQR